MEVAYLSPEHKTFRDGLRTHIQRNIAPYALRWGGGAQCAARSLARAGPRRVSMCVDRSFIRRQRRRFRLQRDHSRGAGTLGSTGISEGVAVHSDIAAPYIARLGTPEQKRRWLPGCVSGEVIAALGMTEPDAGSDVAAMRTSAVRDGDHYVINGQKIFITNGMKCDVIVLAVRTTSAGKANSRHGGVSLIVVEAGTPGFIKHRRLDKMGLHGQDTAELFFEDCRVPVGNLLGVEGGGFKYLMQNLQRERLVVAIGCQAYAERMLEKTIAYAQSRKAFGRPIAAFQHNSFKLAEMATEVKLGRYFIDRLIGDFIAGEDIATEVSMAKWWLSEKANQIAYACVQLHGGYGYMREFEICRDYCDVRAMPIYAGTNEIMKQIIARRMGIGE